MSNLAPGLKSASFFFFCFLFLFSVASSRFDTPLERSRKIMVRRLEREHKQGVCVCDVHEEKKPGRDVRRNYAKKFLHPRKIEPTTVYVIFSTRGFPRETTLLPIYMKLMCTRKSDET